MEPSRLGMKQAKEDLSQHPPAHPTGSKEKKASKSGAWQVASEGGPVMRGHDSQAHPTGSKEKKASKSGA